MITQIVKKFPPEGPLSCSQEPATGPSPEILSAIPNMLVF
jgi:hypothetical protein